MNTFSIKNIATLILLVLLTCLNTSVFGLSDTLYICAGESVQLQTTPNQESYQWFPNQNINNDTIFNPIVSPLGTTTYIVEVEVAPNINLINNGDFSQGLTGISSDYFYTSQSTILQQYFGVFSNTTDFNSWFGDCVDHSPSDDNLMFIADGAITLGPKAWCQEIGVEADETYSFSVWITNVFWTNPPLLEFSINDVPLPEVQVNGQQCLWEEFFSEWYSGNNTTALICVETLTTDEDGNDFAMDDIMFSVEKEDFIDTFTVIVLEQSFVQIDTTICANESFIYDGISIPSGSQFDLSYTAFNGCDSTIFINVGSIDTSYFETRIDTLCPGDITYYLGFPITRDTSICDIYTNSLGCDSSICFVASFFSEATIDFEIETPTCIGDTNGILTAIPTAGIAPFQYYWESGLTNSTIENLSAGPYALTVTDAKGCQAQTTVDLEEPPAIALEYSYFKPSCFGTSDGQLTLDVEGGTPEYLISFDENLLSNNVIENISGGDHYILVEDANNCSAEFSIFINQPSKIEISLEPKISLPLGCQQEINTIITSDDSYQIQWLPATNLSCSSCENPFTSSIENINYQISVEDINGCIAVDTVSVFIEKPYDVFIPNAFSPNGDLVNDYFEIYVGKDVDKISSFTIYNRWGAEVFKRENFLPGDPDAKWDGSFINRYNNSNVFLYVATITFIDGIEKTFSGDVLLIR